MTIGEKIKDCRKKNNLSQKDLGQKLGVSQQHIAQYESGKRIPKLETIQRIATALDVNINDLSESPLDDSPVYKAIKNCGDIESPFSKDIINSRLSRQIDDWEQLDIELVKTFKKLNDSGKAVAVERVEELTEIPRYLKAKK